MSMHEINRRQRQRERLHRLEIMAVLELVALVLVVIIFALFLSDRADVAQQPQEEAEVEITATPTMSQAAVMLSTEPEPVKAPRYDATPAELAIVARVVHAEAIGEGFDGMALVAQTVLNTAEATGKRPDAVVLAPKQYAAPVDKADAQAVEAVKAVFIDGYEVTDEPIRWFYAPARCSSAWHENNLEYVLTHKGHKFFMEKVK